MTARGLLTVRHPGSAAHRSAADLASDERLSGMFSPRSRQVIAVLLALGLVIPVVYSLLSVMAD